MRHCCNWSVRLQPLRRRRKVNPSLKNVNLTCFFSNYSVSDSKAVPNTKVFQRKDTSICFSVCVKRLVSVTIFLDYYLKLHANSYLSLGEGDRCLLRWWSLCRCSARGKKETKEIWIGITFIVPLEIFLPLPWPQTHDIIPWAELSFMSYQITYQFSS